MRRLMILLAAAARRAAGLQQARAARRCSPRCSRLASTAIDEFRAAAGFHQKPTQEKRKRVKRLRHHRNPLSAAATQPAELAEDWAQTIFDDRTRPLIVDVGCALGGWCVESAGTDPSRNFLGLELRPEAVARAQESAQKLPNSARVAVRCARRAASPLRTRPRLTHRGTGRR